MNTTYLKEFVTLAEPKNFWEASERLFMNQSTLSKHIKALEGELGVELFSRSTRHVELTSYGEIFLPYAAAMVRTERDGITALKHLVNIENGLLTIGSIPSIPLYNITQLLSFLGATVLFLLFCPIYSHTPQLNFFVKIRHAVPAILSFSHFSQTPSKITPTIYFHLFKSCDFFLIRLRKEHKDYFSTCFKLGFVCP